MDEIIARNMLSLLELLINRYYCIWLVVYIICINDAWSKKYQIFECFLDNYYIPRHSRFTGYFITLFFNYPVF
jgi:hypothetical protein